MLRLILLRHAKAAQQAGGGDSERPLTHRGRRDAFRVGEYFASHGLFPDLAVVSDARRTRETLELATESFGEPCPVRVEPRLYLAEAPQLLDLLRMTPAFVRQLLAVGHNPGFQEFALMMAGTGDRFTRARLEHGLPTASFSVLDFDASEWAQVKPGSGRLERFVTPDDLRD